MRHLPANALDTNVCRPEGRQFELTTRPFDQTHVQPPPESVHQGFAVKGEVPQHTPNLRAENPGDIGKGQALPSVYPKLAQTCVDPLLALATHSGAEDPQTRPFVRAHHVSGAEGEAKKVKRPVAAFALVGWTAALPAVDNFCLILAQFKRELLQSVPNSPQQFLRLLATGNVNHDVIGVPLELDPGRCRKHPLVEDFVQIQVRKHRADHAALRRAAIAGHKRSVLLHQGCFKPSLAVELDVPLVRMLGKQGQHLPVVDRVKERTDIQVDHVPLLATAGVATPEGIVGSATRPVAVGVGVEHGLHHFLKLRTNHLLRYAVQDRRNAQRTLLAVTLGNALLAHRRGHVATAGQSVPKGVQVTSRIRLDGIHGQTIDTRGFSATTHVLPRLPYLTFAYRLTLCSPKLGHPPEPLRKLELSRFGSPFRGHLRSMPITGTSTLIRVHLPPPYRPFSRPRGSSTCAFRSNRYRWLLLFRDKASRKVLPPLCRVRCGQPSPVRQSRTCPQGLTDPWVFKPQPSFDTSSAVHSRSAPYKSPEAFSASFPSPFSTKTLRFQHRRAV